MANVNKIIDLIKDAVAQLQSPSNNAGMTFESLGVELESLLKENDEELVKMVHTNLEDYESSFFSLSLDNIASNQTTMINNEEYLIKPVFIPVFFASKKPVPNLTSYKNIDSFVNKLKKSGLINKKDFICPINAILGLQFVSEITPFNIFNIGNSIKLLDSSNNFNGEETSKKILQKLNSAVPVVGSSNDPTMYLYTRIFWFYYIKNVNTTSVLSEVLGDVDESSDYLSDDDFHRALKVYNKLNPIIKEQINAENDMIEIDIPSAFAEITDNAYMFNYKMVLPIDIANGESNELHLQISPEHNRLCLIYQDTVVDQPESIDFEEFIFEAEGIEDQANQYREEAGLELIELIIQPEIAVKMQELAAEYDSEDDN